MLNDLYNYAIKNSLSAKPGFKPKKVKAYIILSKQGNFLGIEPAVEEEVMCPDIGSMANGKTKSNIIAEKAEVVLMFSPERKDKHEFFKNALTEASQYDSDLKLCADSLERYIDEIRAEISEKKIKSSDIISFKVDNKSIIGRESYEEWWNKFRTSLSGEKKNNTSRERCMITGALCNGVDTVPKVSGLISVGGHSSGDALICFDKAAFCSYNLKQAHNATVSEEAITAVNSALKELIKKAPVCGGAKVVHWYKDTVSEDEDPMLSFMGLSGWDSNVQEPKTSGEVRKMIQSVLNGKIPAKLQNEYYILFLSGAGGRIMIRGYLQGRCEDLYKAFDAWYSDLSLESSDGSDKAIKLFSVYTRLLKRQNNDRSISERVSKELSGISTRILTAVINNLQLPDMMAAKALQYIKSEMADNGEEKSSSSMTMPDKTCCRILKAWLIRKYGKERTGIMKKLNTDSPSIAYHTGRMMAIFAAIQNAALENVGAGIIERYYSSASTSPALVIGKLSSLSQYHLSKIQNEAYKTRYKKMLEEVSQKIGTAVPKTFSLEEQSQFALGYYQQCAKIFEKTTGRTEE